jgi:16S rRNA pseudouridine516 synthase
MSISNSRLDRVISEKCNVNRKSVRLLVAQKRIKVDGSIVDDVALAINKFSIISFDDKLLQDNTTSYVMLHKPIGVVCATKDNEHKTVIDLLDEKQFPHKKALHIVGRLDLNTSGLVLLTNDSRWSEKLTSPTQKVEKHYLVTLKNPITADYIQAFEKGMYFEYEDITTLPAKLEILSPYQAKVVLTEGKYHQIKRMFGRFRNPVVALHRYAIGDYVLDEALKAGQSKSIDVAVIL